MRIRFTDLDGKVHEENADGLFATCIQHEIDHLNGVLFVDYLSKLKRDRVLKKFTTAGKRAGELLTWMLLFARSALSPCGGRGGEGGIAGSVFVAYPSP